MTKIHFKCENIKLYSMEMLIPYNIVVNRNNVMFGVGWMTSVSNLKEEEEKKSV